MNDWLPETDRLGDGMQTGEKMRPLDLWKQSRGLPIQPTKSPTEESQNPPLPAAPQRRPNSAALNDSTSPKRTQIPDNLVQLEPAKPLSAINDDPVVDEHDAAMILGVKAETLKKWRQREQGPDFIQYGRGGPVRYRVRALNEFRDACTVKPGFPIP